MEKFKEFYYKLYTESPLFIGDCDDYYNMEIKSAMDKYDEILSNPSQYKYVYTIQSTPPLNLYEECDGDDVICWSVPTNNKFIYSYVAYEQMKDGGIITTSVFNDRKFPIVAFRVYNEYLLSKYKYIMCDSRHTPGILLSSI